MRVLLVHNYYGSSAPSGENRVFEAERDLLVRHGVAVRTFTRRSDEIRGKGAWGLVKGAFCTVANPFAALRLRRVLRAFQPDVVHFHNTFPLISPLAVWMAKRMGAPVVLTLHNYRSQCAAGAPTRDGRVCADCIRKQSVGPALRHRCYRSSWAATLPLALNIALYRKALVRWTTKAIALSAFQRDRLRACGWPDGKLVVKGHFVAAATPDEAAGERTGGCYVGRLSDEKGVRTLLAAWRLLGAEASMLTLVGDGDARADYEARAKGLAVRFAGKLPHAETLAALARARFVVLPSVCWESFGLMVAEAAVRGTPAIVSDVGALPELVQGGGGFVFPSGDAKGLAAAVRRLADEATWREMQAAARAASGRYSEEANARQLLAIYREAMGVSHADRIAVLMTCHNRRETTLACLRRLFAARQGARLDVYLVDDGSTDGTGEAVWAAFPRVTVVAGDGTLYWARGMETAWRAAGAGYARYLWLNDDAMLDAGALEAALEADDGRSLVVGTLVDAAGRPTYGLNVNGWVNGNFVLVPHAVFRRIGMICGRYAHAWADGDYALHVRRAGFAVVGCGVVGTTEWHPLRPDLRALSLRERWRSLFDPKGWNLHDLWLYRRRNWGRAAAAVSCVHFLGHVLFTRKRNNRR